MKRHQSPDLQTERFPKYIKMDDEAEPFPHFTDIFLHTHFDGENVKFLQLTRHLPCFVKQLHLEINYKN